MGSEEDLFALLRYSNRVSQCVNSSATIWDSCFMTSYNFLVMLAEVHLNNYAKLRSLAYIEINIKMH